MRSTPDWPSRIVLPRRGPSKGRIPNIEDRKAVERWTCFDATVSGCPAAQSSACGPGDLEASAIPPGGRTIGGLGPGPGGEGDRGAAGRVRDEQQQQGFEGGAGLDLVE